MVRTYSLEDETKDFFMELGNVGIGSSVTTLSNIIDQSISLDKAQVITLDLKRLQKHYGPEENVMVGVLLPFCGDINGQIFFLYNLDTVSQILKTNHIAFKEDELEMKQYDVIQEVASLMASSFMSAVTAFASLKVKLVYSAFSLDMIGSQMSDAISRVTKNNEESICLETSFFIENTNFKNHMIWMLDQSSIELIVTKVGDMG